MILKSLKMINYRPYRGPININFAHSDKMITIIMGDNDLGKTTLLNAISWCLFDDEHYKKNDKKIYNKAAGKNLKNDESLEVLVEVSMENNVGQTINFKRVQKYAKIKNKIKSVGDSKFTAYEPTDSNDEDINDPNSYRETILPKSLQEYFLFDGERLLEWFENDSEAVKKAIERLSQLDLITNVKKRTKLRISDLEDELKVLNPQKAKFIEEKQNLLKQRDEDDKRISKNKKLIEDYNKQIDKDKDLISDLGEDPAKLLKEIDELKMDIAQWEKQKKSVNKEHTKSLIKDIPLVLGSSLLEDNIINRKIKKDNEMNFSFDSNDIDEILNRKKCICGHDIHDDDQSYKILLELRDKIIENETNSRAVKKFNSLIDKSNSIIDKFPNVGDLISDYAEKIAEIDETISDKNIKLKNKRLKYGELDEKYKNLNKKELDDDIKRLEKLIDSCKRKIWNAEMNLSKYPSKLSEVNKKIKIEENKSEQETEIHEKIELCNEVIITCDLLYGKVKKDIHERLVKEVNNEFKNIYNGDGERNKYKRIIINDSFDIQFEELDGDIIPATRPSSGTQLVAALSFITALNSCSGFQLPQVMDTSLGRWGDRLRRNFAETLPSYSQNKQMIFLFLDSEYNLEFRDKIDEYVGEKYKLVFISPEETGIEIWSEKYE